MNSGVRKVKKKMRKRITFWMLLLVMLLMPTIDAKAEETKGVENLLSIKGTVLYKDGVLQEEIPGITYDPETATLTLDNYNEKWEGNVKEEFGTYEAGIYSYGINDLTIKLVGNNVIYVHDSYGIYHENPEGEKGSLTIEGNSLRLEVFGKKGENGTEGCGICVDSKDDFIVKTDMIQIDGRGEKITGIKKNTEVKEEETETGFKFLKGKLWIDTVEGKSKVLYGIDAGSSNLTIDHSDIRIGYWGNQLEKISGIQIGTYDAVTDTKRGGILTLGEKAQITFGPGPVLENIQRENVSLFEIRNLENYRIDIGRSEPEYVSFDEAFSWNEEKHCYENKTHNFYIIEDWEDIPEEDLAYEDVSTDDWFWMYVKYVYDKQLMTGLDENHFGPTEPLARAQFAIILYRMSGEPEVTYSNKFPDVADGLWYTDAIMWASENGIVNGYTDTGLFGPSDKINREQMAVMMYRYAKYCGYNVESEDFSGILDKFIDGNNVNAFAREAIEWAVGKGIISGKNNGTQLDPQGSAIRAECAAIIARYDTTLFEK